MVTLVKHVAKTGKITWKAKVRKKGFPTCTKTFDSKSAALNWSQTAELTSLAPDLPPERLADRVSVGDVLTRYRDTVTPQHRGAVFETDRINAILGHAVCKLPMSHLRTSALAAWRDWRLLQVSNGTVLRELVIIRAAINRARAEWDIGLKESPLDKLVKPKTPEPRDRRLRDGEESRLYDACRKARNTYLAPSIRFAIETAMRQGELVGLRWPDIDFTRRVARLAMTKNGKPRVVPLSTRAVEVLMSLPRTTEYVFEGLRTYSLKHAFVRLTRRAGIVDLKFHDLRHEAISRFVERGLNLIEVAAISGHSGLDMLKRYTHLRPEDIALKLG